jgi:hypothetical protein
VPEITDPYDSSCEGISYELKLWFREWSNPFNGSQVTEDREWVRRILDKDREERRCLQS